MSLRAAVICCGKIGAGFDTSPKGSAVYTHAGAYRALACAKHWGVKVCLTDVAALHECGQPEIVNFGTPDNTPTS